MKNEKPARNYNSEYSGAYLNKVAFPIGGIGAGMICLEGTGAISHVSVRNEPKIFNEPCTFGAIYVKGIKNGAKVLEGPVPGWKHFGNPRSGNGAAGSSFGLPRFEEATFLARFPFGTVTLKDGDIPLETEIIGWSPFIPGDPDNASLPAGALEYHFKNPTDSSTEAVFSYNAKNFMAMGNEGNSIKPIKNGFLLWQEGDEEEPYKLGGFAAFVDDENVVVNHGWFRGGWWDPLTIAWKHIEEGNLKSIEPKEGPSPGASLYVPFTLQPGEEKTIRLSLVWYVPKTNIRVGVDLDGAPEPIEYEAVCCEPDRKFHVPWYAGKFSSIEEVAKYWSDNYDDLLKKTKLFSDTLYDTTLPNEVVEAISANLSILKSPTVKRQCDGKLWCWEGCSDNSGCCSGSCTHVWNYAQALPHLFPSLERTLRETEFQASQDNAGHQVFRSALPIRPQQHKFHAASDGQLGGIMKMYREWRILGDTKWLKKLWPSVRNSLEYCIKVWDPKRKGILEEPHHNTYDIEFWGPDGMCTSFYLGALTAAIEMGKAVGDDVSKFEQLLEKGKNFMDSKLYDGEYFYQIVQWEGLESPNPVEAASIGYVDYSEEAIELLKKEGPKYQYGKGCISDGVLGFWIARVCGLDEILDPLKVTSHLKSVHKYNLKHDLSDHANPQRPSYALGKDGGLLLCTWPKGGALTLPFVYSNEVWTGIEYQVASHLMLEGLVNEGLEIVRICRDRYDGTVRNPFNEYECGHWYARALASYGLIQGLTGVRFDAIEKTLYINSKIGDNFRSFLSTATGFGTVGLKSGKPFVEVKVGAIDVDQVVVSEKKMML